MTPPLNAWRSQPSLHEACRFYPSGAGMPKTVVPVQPSRPWLGPQLVNPGLQPTRLAQARGSVQPSLCVLRQLQNAGVVPVFSATQEASGILQGQAQPNPRQPRTRAIVHGHMGYHRPTGRLDAPAAHCARVSSTVTCQPRRAMAHATAAPDSPPPITAQRAGLGRAPARGFRVLRNSQAGLYVAMWGDCQAKP